MNGNPKIGQRAKLSRIRVGQCIQFDHVDGVVYKVLRPYRDLPSEGAGHAYQAVDLDSGGFVFPAYYGTGEDSLGNIEVTVVPTPKQLRGKFDLIS